MVEQRAMPVDGIAVIGNVSVDHIRHADGRTGRSLGGAALLVSLAATRASRRAAPVCVLGGDLAHLPNARGFDALEWSGARHAGGATARFVLSYDDEGNVLAANAEYGVAEALTAHALGYLAAHPARTYHVCCRRPLDVAAVLAGLRAVSAEFSVDFFLPSAREMIRCAAPWLPGASTVFVNEAEYRLLRLTVDCAGLPEVVVTDGPRAVRLLHFGQETARVTPPARLVRDVVGAGDTLAGTFLAHRLGGAPPGRALAHAVTAASDYAAAPSVPVPRPPH